VSVVPESGTSVTPLAEASPPEGRAGEVAAPAPVLTTIAAPSTDASAPHAIAFADAILVEIIETVTVVVPGQNADEDEGAAITASRIAGIETSVTEESSRPQGGYVAFVGRISPEKGPLDAIRIAQSLDIPLKNFREMVQPMLSTAGVEFIGEISEKDKGPGGCACQFCAAGA
jgi:glycosyltransferase involved in cell wall biosynthesis